MADCIEAGGIQNGGSMTVQRSSIKWSIAISLLLLMIVRLSAQTTSALVTGVITDSTGAVVPGAKVTATNRGTGLVRVTTSSADGIYTLPQLSPGAYDLAVKKQGFAVEDRPNVLLHVNQNATINFSLSVSATPQTVTVTDAPPPLNTTSATLSQVVGHAAVVQLPLNGRQFTQLALLTPGVAPQEGGQQKSFMVSLGAGGIVPAVNGQRPQQDDFTMDGVLNNNIYLNSWAISPPPDALDEFNVQSHITDAQFAISSGANINIVTRSGTNDFHGSLWEFFRNSALDAQTFPATERLPYRQNQYGVYLGGPLTIPHLIRGKDNTWFALYWEGFRSAKSNSYFGSTLTSAMRAGDFSALLGKPVGTDGLGRPEYANEIYDPATSRQDPANPATIIRDPFPGNIIPSDRINPASALLIKKYYPLPNLNVAAGVLPNLRFNGTAVTASDQAGIRVDHRFGASNTIFGRYNRTNINLSTPQSLPGYLHTLRNYAQTASAGYTHLFGPETLLTLHYAYTQTNVTPKDQPAGAAFNNAINFTNANPAESNPEFEGPQLSVSNGYGGISQTVYHLGPQQSSDSHVDVSKVIRNHTLGAGGMFYHIDAYNDAEEYNVRFTQNATSQGALTSSTGLGPASLLLGLPDNLNGWIGNPGVDQTVNWYGLYAQDQWQMTKKLAVTMGLRYDYITPPNYHRIMSALDAATGQFIITAPYPPLFPTATGPSGFFYPQYNGFQPRLGISYQAASRTVLQAAGAIMDDHDNTLVQENQDIHHAWPDSLQTHVVNQNRGVPNLLFNDIPPAPFYLNSQQPYVSLASDPHNQIPYSIEYNAGVEQQLLNSLVINLDYVGSVGRHQLIEPTVNTAMVPGPGPLATRGQPFAQFSSGTFGFDTNAGNSSYNALQIELKKSVSSGLFFNASYTWSKSLDIMSSGQDGSIENGYNIRGDWGPSSFNRSQMFVLSGVYALPFGRGQAYLSSNGKVVQALAGGWNVGSIISLISGTPFDVLAGGDVANVGGGTQRANRVGAPYSGQELGGPTKMWLNKAGFAVPAKYTFGNEGRNDLVGPPFKNVDFSAFKDFSLLENAKLEFRSEFFNVFNHTNYGVPSNNVQSSSFGQILGANGNGREIQFALKVMF